MAGLSVNMKKINEERKKCSLKRKGAFCLSKGEKNAGCENCFNPVLSKKYDTRELWAQK
jgi:hypothetical protein